MLVAHNSSVFDGFGGICRISEPHRTGWVTETIRSDFQPGCPISDVILITAEVIQIFNKW